MIAVIGAGKWGSALAHAFASAGNEVLLCSARAREGYASIAEAKNCEYLVFAIDSKNTAKVLEENFQKLFSKSAADAELAGRKFSAGALACAQKSGEKISSQEVAARSKKISSQEVDVQEFDAKRSAAQEFDAQEFGSQRALKNCAPDASAQALCNESGTDAISCKAAKRCSEAHSSTAATSASATATSTAATATSTTAAASAAATATSTAQASHKVLIASKGLFHGELLSERFCEYFSQIAILSGPSFAAEVQQNLPTAVVISSANAQLAAEFAALFPPFMKPYCSGDIIGAQIAGAYKNVIAIASGICDALELGNNARAALLSRGLVEISRFSEVFGAKSETILGLAGAGDLFLTASSTLSRNYRAGALLAAGCSAEQTAERLGEVVEGFAAAREITAVAANYGIHTPIAAQVFAILGGKDIRAALADLLKR